MDLKTFGEQLQMLRKQAGMSQEQLAKALERLACAGPAEEYRVIDGTLISRWEQARVQRGRQWKPTRPYLLHLIRLFAGQLDIEIARQWALQAGYQFGTTELQEVFPHAITVHHRAQGGDAVQPLARNARTGPHPGRRLIAVWGEAPDVSRFYGRTNELATLARWLAGAAGSPRARLVAILGMGGVGKTTLAAQVARQIAGQFDRLIWRSLLNAPPLEEILRVWLQGLSVQGLTNLPDSLDARLDLLFGYLRQARCLLVLDNLESILQGGEQAGEYRAGYEAYGLLIRRMGESDHQSCLLLTGRERTRGIERLEDGGPFVRTFQLAGLTADAGQELLSARGLASGGVEAKTLIARYSGNPLALQLIARTIEELFSGDVAAFLRQETLIFDDIRDVLDQQFRRLSPLQRSLLVWLAIERDVITLDTLAQNLTPKPAGRSLLEAVRALQRRSLLEKSADGFTLQNVVTEYVTDFLIQGVCQEIKAGELTLIRQYALCKAGAKEFIRQSQLRMILLPIAERLVAELGRRGLEKRLYHLLARLRSVPADAAHTLGYAAGNILNLLLYLGYDVQGYDFSGLNVWQAYLRGVTLPQLNFAGADLTGSVFTEAFHDVVSLAFSPQGDLLAAGTSDGSVRLWQVSDGQLAHLYTGHHLYVWSVAFSPATVLGVRLLASAGEDGTVRIWAVDTGELLSSLEGHTSWVRTVVFSPDGQLLASASGDQTVRVWDLSAALNSGGRTEQHRFVLEGHTGWVRTVAFSPDGQLLASAGDDHTIRLWDANTGASVRSWSAHTDWIRSLAFRPNGRWLASAGDDQTICVWEVASGRSLHVLRGHGGPVMAVAFRPPSANPNSDAHSILASGSWDQTVRLWDAESGQLLTTLFGHTYNVLTVTFNRDGTLLASGGNDHSVRVWDVRSGQPVHLLRGSNSLVRAVAFNRDDQLLAAGSDDQGLRVWDFGAGFVHNRFYGQTRWWLCVAFHPDGDLVASAISNGAIRVWNLRSGEVFRTFHTQDSSGPLAFSDDGRWLAAVENGQTVTLWAVAEGRIQYTLSDHPCPISCIALSPDGAFLASGGKDQTVRLWDLRAGEGGRLVHTLPTQSRWVETLAFSPDGQTLAAGGNQPTVRLWDTQTGQLLAVLYGHTNTVSSLAFSPDGQTLVTGSYDQTVQLWDIGAGYARLTLHGHTSWIRSVAFNRHGTTVASGGDDETVRLWHVQTGACLVVLRAEEPYAGMNITGATGITPVQKAALKALGAVEW